MGKGRDGGVEDSTRIWREGGGVGKERVMEEWRRRAPENGHEDMWYGGVRMVLVAMVGG